MIQWILVADPLHLYPGVAKELVQDANMQYRLVDEGSHFPKTGVVS